MTWARPYWSCRQDIDHKADGPMSFSTCTAQRVVEKALVNSGWHGPLLLFNRQGRSSVYSEPFRDPAQFPRILDKARQAISSAWPTENPKIGRVFVSSFSAGFGGIRELLAVPDHFANRRLDPCRLALCRLRRRPCPAANRSCQDGRISQVRGRSRRWP